MYPKVGKLYLKVGYNGLPYKPVVLTQQFMADCITKKTLQRGVPDHRKGSPFCGLKAVRLASNSIGETSAAFAGPRDLSFRICIILMTGTVTLFF